MQYQDYHTHPVNKIIHFFCIPMIVLTSVNFLSKSNLSFLGMGIYSIALITLLSYYLYYYGLSTFFLMFIYYTFIDYYSEQWTKRRYWFIESMIIFISSWVLQFIGHYIEGSRPALMDSLTTAVTQAPLFSIMYLFETIGYIVNFLINLLV